MLQRKVKYKLWETQQFVPAEVQAPQLAERGALPSVVLPVQQWAVRVTGYGVVGGKQDL